MAWVTRIRLPRSWPCRVGPLWSQPIQNFGRWGKHFRFMHCRGTKRKFVPALSWPLMGVGKPELCAGGFLATQRQEVLRAFDGGGHLAQEFLQIMIVLDKVDF